MAKQTRNFKLGRMNKSIDERLLPDGEYVDAMNIRVGSTELTEIGAVENTKGNIKLTTLQYNGVALSEEATCIGTLADSEEETLYWFVHDPANTQAAPPSAGVLGKVDMIVSYDTQAQQLTYHVVSETVLNFDPAYLINGVDKIDDLLFFTDNYNEPRKINVTSDYPFPDITLAYGLRDQIIELDISVIKPPPLESPTVEFAQVAGGENYIKDTFICFAYRYQYADGEYSALSQFTAPAFAPNSNFILDFSSYLNDSMQNIWNEAQVTFKTGDSRVKRVDVVFKEADSNNIFVIEEYDVSDLNNNSDFQTSFTNGEIYTVLNSEEILRLYDNVPLKSKAQNIFGNRLLYGNYVEQRDLTDSSGQAIDLTYTVASKSTEVAGGVDVPLSLGTFGGLNVDSTLSSPPNISQGVADVDFSGVGPSDLIEGNFIQFTIQFRGAGFSYSGSYPDEIPASNQANASFNTAAVFPVTFTVRLDQSYTSAQSFFQGNYFRTAWGWDTAQADPNDWPSGTTWIDLFNAAVPSVNNTDSVNNPLTFEPVVCMATRRQVSQPPVNNFSPPVDTEAGPTSDFGGISFYWDTNINRLRISPPAHRYRKDTGPNDCSGTNSPVFQYFSIVSASATVFGPKSSQSLHSNREYQVGIVYQDSNARQSTVLVSERNSVNVDVSNSININSLEVTIPEYMKPPSWAERYKFMVKPSQGLYETIYANVAFLDEATGMTWIKLEGEQANKVTEGLRLIVKADANGALNNVITTTVLEVADQPNNFLTGGNTPPFVEPAGVYMKVRPAGWSADTNEEDSFVYNGSYASDAYMFSPFLAIPLQQPASTNISVNAGDIVNMRFRFIRRGISGRCTDYECIYENQIVAQQDYANFKDFWDLQGVNVQAGSTCQGNSTYYDPTLYTDPYAIPLYPNQSDSVDNWFYFFDGIPPNPYLPDDPLNPVFGFCWGGSPPVTNLNGPCYQGDGLYLILDAGPDFCDARSGRNSAIYATISITPANGKFVFETIPSKVADGIYYEGADNYAITNGNHMSGTADGDQDQIVGSQEAKVNLSFFNCFAFGNGVESYRILDSLTGNFFTLGNRSAGVTTQDYEQIRREASITYSGLYQEQTALNNLNSFNLGLANYKDCEESYGPIEVLHSFRDNLLVLQEDKISYIQVNKSLISGADGSNIVTATPTILGQQIARIEEYGISNNPESFATYGRDMYFTDAKRSSVIKLSGSVTQGDSLQAISSIGMRSWFRDLFQDSFTTQKLGGYDPYMNEYVLASNTTNLPLQIPTTSCRGRTVGAYLPPVEWTGLIAATQYIVNAGSGIGIMNIEFTADYAVTVSAVYNGVETSNPSGPAGDTGTFTVSVSKNLSSISEVLITVTPVDPNPASVTTMNPPCPTGSEIKVVMVCLTDDVDSGETIINQYRYEDTPYVSPLTSENVTFLSGSTSAPVVSQFFESNGIQGTPSFPTANSTVTLLSNGGGSSTFTFQPNLNQLAYVAAPSGTTYPNTPAGIANMLAASTVLPTNTSQAPVYTAQVDLTPAPAWSTLYLIYDYRGAGQAMFCHTTSIDPNESYDVCCECTVSAGCTPFIGSGVETTSTLACAAAKATTYYHDGSGVAPEIGDNIYSLSDCETPVRALLPNTTENYISLGDGTNSYIKVLGNGEIIAKTSC